VFVLFYFDPVCSIFMYGMRCILFVLYHEDMGNAVEKDGPYSARHHVQISMMEMRCSMTREMKEGKTAVIGTAMNSARHNTLTHILGTATYSNNNTIRKDKKQLGGPAFKGMTGSSLFLEETMLLYITKWLYTSHSCPRPLCISVK